MPPVLLDARQLADKLDATYEDVLRWARQGLIPSIKTGGKRYFNLNQVAKRLNGHAKTEHAYAGAN